MRHAVALSDSSNLHEIILRGHEFRGHYRFLGAIPAGFFFFFLETFAFNPSKRVHGVNRRRGPRRGFLRDSIGTRCKNDGFDGACICGSRKFCSAVRNVSSTIANARLIVSDIQQSLCPIALGRATTKRRKRMGEGDEGERRWAGEGRSLIARIISRLRERNKCRRCTAGSTNLRERTGSRGKRICLFISTI